MKITTLVLPALLLGAAATLLAPAPQTYAFSTLGGSLSVDTQRDFRVFNNFADATANNNQTPDPSFPGWQGAYMAIWKGATEWASVPHGGDGAGDPDQALGDGGANFEFAWSGAAAGAGGSNDNIVSAIPSCGSDDTLAFVQTPISNGWTMKFCDNKQWNDGPDSLLTGQFDLQGVATHEFGHALGLGHSGSGNATMYPSTPNGVAQRSIANDDKNGVQAIYGAMSASKPEITGIVLDANAQTVRILGEDFSSTGNQVWFTNANVTSVGADPRVIVSGVASTGGGTEILVGIPAGAGPGDVHVRKNASGHASLSNGWPMDPDVSSTDAPVTVASMIPTTVAALEPGSAQTVTVTGSGFFSGVSVSVFFTPVPSENVTVIDDETLTVDLPQLDALGLQALNITNGEESDSVFFTVEELTAPTLQCGTGDPLNTVSGSFEAIVGGQVGSLHYVLYSSSNAPSSRGLVTLDIGAGFTDLFLLDTFTVAAKGWTSKTFPLPPLTGDFYLQGITLDEGFPIPTSNVQSIHVVP